MSEERSKNIIAELRRSFLEDKKVFQEQIIEAETEIRQCKDFIESLTRKDDNDYNVFSPRRASSVYKGQVEDKKAEIATLEEEVRTLYKKLSNVTKKLDSLNDLDPAQIGATVDEAAIMSAGGKSKLLELQEDDRQRIAADLHDTVLQNLSLVMHNLELSAKFIDYDPIRAKLEIESNRKLVKDTIDDIRSTIFDLRPMQFDDFGFKRTLENQINNYRTRTSMEFNYDIDELDNIDNIYLITVFRVTQELMINAIKHSRGTKLYVVISRNESGIHIYVSDNGVGMSNPERTLNDHFGLKILKERVDILKGFVKIESSEDKGTQVSVDIPITEGKGFNEH
ncbi:MAG: sensor histidine kinase [Lachnospiraceae bacterium]|nr:sensor histidine kinase [Lachnospiraceae bacterium]